MRANDQNQHKLAKVTDAARQRNDPYVLKSDRLSDTHF
jgi:hypothetical protein